MAGINVQSLSKALPVAGTLELTTTPQQLPPADFAHGLTELELQADADNTDDVLIGNASAQIIRLHPDDDYTIPLQDPGAMWAKAKNGTQLLHYLGRD